MSKITLASIHGTNNYTLLQNSRLGNSLTNYSKEGILNMKKQKILEWIKNYRATNQQVTTPVSSPPIATTTTAIDTRVKETKNNEIKCFVYEVGKNSKEYLPKLPKTPFEINILGNYRAVRSEFTNNKYLHAFRYNDNVHRISPFAFYNCPNLDEVYIGKYVSFIADTAFKSFSDIVKFRVHKENKHFNSIEGYLFNKDCTKLLHGPFYKLQKKIYLAPTHPDKPKLLWDRITSFGSHVLTNYGYLPDIEFPPNLRSFGESALELFSTDGLIKTPKNLNKLPSYMFKNIGFKNFKLNDSRNNTDNPNSLYPSIYISQAVSIISETAFDSFFGKVEVDKNNKNFCSYNNAIFNKDKSKLIRFISPTLNPNDRFISPTLNPTANKSAAKKFVVPHGTICIADYAFYNSLVEEISIPETVKHIGVGVFNTCKNLKRINFSPRIDLRKFGTFSFYKCNVNRCIEIMSSPEYKHWTDNNFGNIFLYSGETKMTSYVEDDGLVPDVPAYTEYLKIINNILNLKGIELDEKSSLYKKFCNKCKIIAKRFISNGSDNKTIKKEINYFANVWIAVKACKINLQEADPTKYYDGEDQTALRLALNETIGVEETMIYDVAYASAYNSYLNARTISNEISKLILNSNKHDSFFNGKDALRQSMVAFRARTANEESPNMIRIKLTFRNNSIISNNKDYPITSKSNDYFMMLACNLILSAANETGASTVGPIRLPNRILMKNFYANYHIEPKVRNAHPKISCTSFDNRSTFMGGKTVGNNGAGNSTATIIHIIEPTTSTVNWLTNYITKKPVGLKIFIKNNKEKCMNITVKIKSTCIDYRRNTEKNIISKIKENGALAIHGPLYGRFTSAAGTNLLNSKYVDRQTRENVIEENFLTRIIDIVNPTEQTIITLGKQEIPEIINISVKLF